MNQPRSLASRCRVDGTYRRVLRGCLTSETVSRVADGRRDNWGVSRWMVVISLKEATGPTEDEGAGEGDSQRRTSGGEGWVTRRAVGQGEECDNPR